MSYGTLPSRFLKAIDNLPIPHAQMVRRDGRWLIKVRVHMVDWMYETPLSEAQSTQAGQTQSTQAGQI